MLYDALGRLAVRDVWESDHTESCYLYDGTRCVMEFGGTPPAQLYVYDDVGQLIFWQFGSDDLLPVQNVDNSLWLVFRRSALAASAPTSATIKYQTLFEEQTWDPFGAGQILAYSGSPAPTVIGESRLHIGTGGRLYCAQEGLYNNGARFYDPVLQRFISTDPGGNWSDPRGFGSSYVTSGQNPAMFHDDGGMAFLLALWIIGGMGIGAGLNMARQGIQLWEGSRQSFSWEEVGSAALAGGVMAGACYLFPILGPALIGVGGCQTYYQWKVGDIYTRTALFDAATLVAPFLVKPAIARLRLSLGRPAIPTSLEGIGKLQAAGEAEALHTSTGLADNRTLEMAGFQILTEAETLRVNGGTGDVPVMAGGFRFGFIDATILRGGLGDFYSGYQNLDRGTPDHLHHLFPEARRGWFERRGFTGVFDIDNFCVRISRPVHEAIHMNVHRQKRWMTLPEGWNHRIMWRLVQLEGNLGAKLNVEDDFPAIWTIVRDLVHEFGLPRTLEIYPVHRRR